MSPHDKYMKRLCLNCILYLLQYVCVCVLRGCCGGCIKVKGQFVESALSFPSVSLMDGTQVVRTYLLEVVIDFTFSL